MRFKNQFRRGPVENRDPDELLVEAAYRGLLNKAPDAQGFQFCLSALKNGLAWEEFLRNILSWHEFEPPMQSSPMRVFELLMRERASLEGMDADVTIELSADVGLDRMTMLRGPVRDASVFTSIIQTGGMWEPNVTKFLTNYLSPGHVFVDVGANLGYFTIVGGVSVGPEGRVVSFEPAGSNLEYLRRNVDINELSNVQVVPYALWNSRGTLSMAVPDDFLGGAHVNEPIVESGDAGQAGDNAVCAPLDELVSSGEVELSQCRLMKIDIEGSEPFALDGMQATLAALRPAIVIEVNPHCLAFLRLGPEAVWDRLNDLGYFVGVLPQPHQIAVLSRLPAFPFVEGACKLESCSQMQEILAELSSDGPAWLDLVALPNELAERT
ncbi:MAG: FkbM family methyltransferase [Actinomycetota bacterium]